LDNRNQLHEKGKSLEADYFNRQERELLEKLRLKGQRERARKELAEATGVSDEKTLNELLELGFDRSTVSLLHLVPLVEVAWAEGFITDRERALIVEAAAARGVSEGAAGWELVTGWLDHRPEEAFFRTATSVIAAMLDSLEPVPRQSSQKDLLELCSLVAGASGGILGFGNKVSQSEQALIERITRELQEGGKVAG